MAPARWQLITEIFHRAVAFGDAAEREAYLQGACHSDPSLREEIDSLLEAHADTSSVVDGPLSGDARVVNRLASGTTLGPYQIERLLGAGGMGDVYRALDTRLGRTVALKILPIHLRSKPQLLGRFEREARAIAGLNHPYICTLHDVGRHEDIDFLVMELIEGETLAERLRNGPLPIDEAVRLAHEIAEALAAAHAKGIIHRDIKPSNIFVTKGGHVKVIDFGLAKESSLFHSSESTQEDRTQPGVTIGTLLYMSPEQALGQPLDPRTDLFSLGVVLFECLTGELPFVGQSRIEYLPNLLAGRLKSVAALRPEVPPQLQAVLARCLEHDTGNRLDSASWLAAELDRIGPGPRGSVPWKWVFGVASVAGIVGLVIAYWPPPGPEGDTTVPQLLHFTLSPGEEIDSRLSPDGMWMSFIATERGERQLLVQQVDGGQPMPVKLPAGEVQGHVWSPNQDAFACLLLRSPDLLVQIVPRYFGSEVRSQTVIVPPIPRGARLLRWIGSVLYLQVEESGRSPSLRRLDLDSGVLDRLQGPWDDMNVRGFDIGPDGRQVLWSAAAQRSLGDDLWVADLTGGRRERVTAENDGSRKRFPVWNGPGTGVIYQSNRGRQIDLWELDLKSGQSIQLSTAPGVERPESTARTGSFSYQLTTHKISLYIWKTGGSGGTEVDREGLNVLAPGASSGGRPRLVFQRNKSFAEEGSPQVDSDIFTAEVVTEPAIGLTGVKRVATGYAPRLSPDGKFLAYLQRRQNSTFQSQLMVTNVETPQDRNPSPSLTTPSSQLYPLEWVEQTLAWTSPRDLYFAERLDGSGEQLAHYRVGSSARRVPATETAGRITEIYPSSDGQRIAYVSRKSGKVEGQWTFQLHVLDVATGSVRLVKDMGLQYVLYLRGWIRNDSELVVARAAARPAPTSTYELMTVSLAGEVRPAPTVEQVASVSQVAPRFSELYFTRSEAGIGNMYAYSFATRKERQVSDNRMPDVTFGGVVPLGPDYVVGIRHERTADLYLSYARPRAKPAGGKQ